MNTWAVRLLTLGCGLVLASLLQLGWMQESVGFSEYHEVVCSAVAAPRQCRPNGRTVQLLRTLAADTQKPISLRIESYSAKGLPETHADYFGCIARDTQNLACPRQVIGLTAESAAVPWRLVQGRLLNDAALAAGNRHFLNNLQLWRNRLLWGDYEY